MDRRAMHFEQSIAQRRQTPLIGVGGLGVGFAIAAQGAAARCLANGLGNRREGLTFVAIELGDRFLRDINRGAPLAMQFLLGDDVVRQLSTGAEDSAKVGI